MAKNPKFSGCVAKVKILKVLKYNEMTKTKKIKK